MNCSISPRGDIKRYAPRNHPMWKVSATTTSAAEDAVAELLGEVLGVPASAYTDFESGTTTVTVYSEACPPRLPAKLAALRDGLTRIRRCGLNVGSGRVRAQRFSRKNWAESWKRHFQPLEIGDALLIQPSWSKRRPSNGQAVVVLDPGLCFGTGHHPTTLFCLRELVQRRKSLERQRPAGEIHRPGCHNTPASRRRHQGLGRSFLDLGTGSGILAIAAAKLGYAPVHALDSDPEAVRIAHSNARTNGVSRQVRIVCQDLTQLPLHRTRHYDVICANLLSTLLVAERNRIVHQLKPGGVLVAAGILESEFDLVARDYRRTGLRLVATKRDREWQSATFEG